MQPFSIVIINFNGYEYVNSLISSIYRYNRTVSEIIVVDDCSTDDSYLRLKAVFPCVKFLSTNINSGPGAARNIGIRFASNNLVFVMDNDIEVTSNTLQVLLDAQYKYDQYTFYVPRVLYYSNPSIVQKEGTDFHYLGMSLNTKNHSVSKYDLSGELDFQEITAYPGVCFLVKKNNLTIEYDNDFFYTFEDLDFSIRNTLIGCKALLVRGSEVLHKDGTAGLSYRKGATYPSRRMFYLIRNRWFFIIKNYSLKLLLKVLPVVLLADLFLLLFSIYKCEDKLIFLKSYKSLFLLLPTLLKKRRKTKVFLTEDMIFNIHLKFGKQTYGSKLLRRIFNLLDRLLFLYGKYIIGLNEKKIT